MCPGTAAVPPQIRAGKRVLATVVYRKNVNPSKKIRPFKKLKKKSK